MFARVGFGLFILRADAALLDPAFDDRNLSRLERFAFAFRRHALKTFLAEDVLQDQTVVGLDRQDRSADPALLHQRNGVEPQLRLLLDRAVARITTPRQDRFHLAHVIDGLAMRGLRDKENT